MGAKFRPKKELGHLRNVFQDDKLRVGFSMEYSDTYANAVIKVRKGIRWCCFEHLPNR